MHTALHAHIIMMCRYPSVNMYGTTYDKCSGALAVDFQRDNTSICEEMRSICAEMRIGPTLLPPRIRAQTPARMRKFAQESWVARKARDSPDGPYARAYVEGSESTYPYPGEATRKTGTP
jgi:hypothetical protein